VRGSENLNESVYFFLSYKMTRSYHYVRYPGGWYRKFIEKAHPNAIKEVIQTDKTYSFPKRSLRFNRRGKMVVSHCTVCEKCSECEKVVSKKGEPKAGAERKTTNRCNRHTMIDMDAIYETPSWLDSWSHYANSVEEGMPEEYEQIVFELPRD
jgi:hypothetical protein